MFIKMDKSTRLGDPKLPLVLLHIGTEKTGTTSIQAFIHRNRSRLASQGIYTIKGFGKLNNREFVSFFQNNLDEWSKRNEINSISEKQRHFLDFEKRFVRELRSRKIVSGAQSCVLLTSEHFSSRLASKEELEQLRGFLERYFEHIKILCFFRPQAEMAVSRYSTGLRAGVSSTLEEKLRHVTPEKRYYNFERKAKLWECVFGKENLVFDIYDKRGFPHNDVRRQFVNIMKSAGIKVDPQSLNFDPDYKNETLPALAGSVFAAINEVMPPISGYPTRSENEKLKRRVLAIPSLSKGRIAAGDLASVQNRFDETNKRFFDEFMPGRRFQLTQPNVDNELICLRDAERAVYDLTKELLLQEISTTGRALKDSDADYLRDVSTKIMNQEPLDITDAVSLLELALRARPGGKRIREKLDIAQKQPRMARKRTR